MHQQEIARQAWRGAGLYDAQDKATRAFLDWFEQAPAGCWPDAVGKVRTDHPALKGKLAAPLWNSGDKVVRLNLLRCLDPRQPDELALLTRFTAKLDLLADTPEIQVIARSDHPEVLDRLARRRGLPADLAAAVRARRDAAGAHS